MQEFINVIHFRVDEDPKEVLIPNRLWALQEMVGGYIEIMTLTDDILLVCNEYGKIQNLPFNRYVFGERSGDRIHGNFFLCKADGEGLASLSLEEAEEYLDLDHPDEISVILV